MTTEELQSKIFDILRFPLIIGVIFIHNYGIGEGTEFVYAQSHNSLFYITNQLFSQILGRIAVPIFFLMSGYLFFYKTEFNLIIYKKKLISRIKSLLIPYIFWNTAFVVIYFLVDKIPLISSFFQNSADYNFRYFIECFVGKVEENQNMSYPAAYQFWFIRDLIVMVIFSPLIHLLLVYSKKIGIIILGLFWYFGLTLPFLGVYGFSSIALFFFSLGAYFSINRKNLVTICSVFGSYFYILYAILVFTDLITIGSDIHKFIHNAGIIIGIICCFNLSSYFINCKGFKINTYLSKASFFVFAIHDPWVLSTLRKIINRLFYYRDDFSMVLMYLIEIVATIYLSLLIYKILKRTMPRFTAIISGGR